MPSNNPSGRRPGWAKGKGPRTVGAVTMERFDENGCFEDEWRKIEKDTEKFSRFAKPGGCSDPQLTSLYSFV